VIFLTAGAVFACVSGNTITMEIVHVICTISTILAWLASTIINVCGITKKKKDFDRQMKKWYNEPIAVLSDSTKY